MKSKKIFYTEFTYIVGLFALALGASLTEKAGFGMSMIIAPAYIIYLKLSQFLSFFTFGMSAYIFEGLLILILIVILRKFKFSYILSFFTAVIYGFILDGMGIITEMIPNETMFIRILLFVFGICLSSLGVAFMFKTYFPPEAYELIVKEISDKYNFKLNKVKTCYDLFSLCLAVVLSFVFFGFGKYNGINIGTLITALLNGTLVGFFNKKLELIFTFKDKFKLREIF